ncbi:secreted phosphoprotein 24 isoform X2 [Pseudorasbora parva]|uniref:secreted phosphoprotein 24 isoform X2 n=1 Tax=Pseudorasbora parva TaxID=51549 RepID=UPI00351EB1FE
MNMRCCVFPYLLLQVLGGLGLPLFELSSKADDALQMALNQINARYARNHLYRVSKASVKRIVPLGMETFDLHLKFGIRETECQKTSGTDPQGCMYRKGFFVGGLYYDLNHFGTRDRTYSTLPPSINVAPPIHTGHHDNRETNHVRGDNFNNHLPYH